MIEEVYEKIAQHFHETRFSHWKKVKAFILALPAHATVLDIGCGNAKYSTVRQDIHYIGTDITENLLNKSIHQRVHPDVFRASCIHPLPIRPHTVDAILHIAVLHHFPEESQRLHVLKSFFHLLSPSGKLIVTVWAYEQSRPKKRDTKWKRVYPNDKSSTDYLIPWHDRYTGTIYDRFYHLYTYDEALSCIHTIENEFPTHYGSISFDTDNWVLEFHPRK